MSRNHEDLSIIVLFKRHSIWIVIIEDCDDLNCFFFDVAFWQRRSKSKSNRFVSTVEQVFSQNINFWRSKFEKRFILDVVNSIEYNSINSNQWNLDLNKRQRFSRCYFHWFCCWSWIVVVLQRAKSLLWLKCWFVFDCVVTVEFEKFHVCWCDRRNSWACICVWLHHATCWIHLSFYICEWNSNNESWHETWKNWNVHFRIWHLQIANEKFFFIRVHSFQNDV